MNKADLYVVNQKIKTEETLLNMKFFLLFNLFSYLTLI